MSPSAAELDLAVATLVDPSLASIVEMVLTRRDGAYEAHAVDGSVRFRRHDPAAAPRRGRRSGLLLRYAHDV